MLDENLPTFRFQPSKDSPTNTLLYFSERGSDPTPAFLLRRPDPSAPTSRNKYAVALADPSFPDIIYAEVLVEPEWSRPPLSTAEARAQHHSSSQSTAPATPLVPDSVSLTLYDPDQTVVIRRVQSGWNRSETWEFEMPERTFKVPSASLLDRSQQTDTAEDPTVPKIMFRWKRDGRMSKDMTCYLVGKSVDGKKSREPDITIALFSQGKIDAVTMYEPNMRRVELEDRKGLEVVLLLGAEVIRSLYLSPKSDVFNLSSSSASSSSSPGRRKNSRPPTTSAAAPPVMSGATVAATIPPQGRPHSKSNPVDAETKRLQALVAEDEQRKAKERERRDREEQERIRKMLHDEEERERRRREEEVEKETERLRREYGVQGQILSSSSSPSAASGPPPVLPPRHQHAPSGGGPASPQALAPPGAWPPARPVSAGPYAYAGWSPPPSGAAGPSTQQFAPPPTQAQQAPGGGGAGGAGGQQGGPKKKIEGLVNTLTPYASEAAASVSGLLHRNDKKKVQKKRSVHF